MMPLFEWGAEYSVFSGQRSVSLRPESLLRGALHGLVKDHVFGAELAHLGIRINSVATTLTTGTPAHDRFLAAKDAGSQEVIVKAFTKAEQRVKFKLNTAEDLAEYILYLSSRESDQVSGSTLSINGGLSFPSY